jgi:hypothetical protein
MRIRGAAWGVGVFLVLLALTGCDSGPPTGEVKGTVKVDGKLVEEGAIGFSPVDGKTATAGGMIKDGQYAVKVPVGLMKVSISMPKVVGHKKIYPTPNSPTMPVTVEGLPARYNEKTELQFEVKAGLNEKDYDLKGR